MVLDLALDRADRPHILVLVGALQITAPFLGEWALVGGALWLHALDFVEFTAEVIALNGLVKEHGISLGHGNSGQGGD